MATARTKRGTATAGGSLANKQLKAQWDQHITAFHEATGDESRGWDARYEALDAILSSDPPCYLAGGYKTTREFLKAEVPDLSERTVRQYIRIARHFDPDDESRYGIAKLESLIDYLEAENGGKLPKATIDPAKTKVRVKVRGKLQTLWFSQATREQLRAVARAADVSKGQSGRVAEPAVVKKVKAVLKGTAFAAVAVSAKKRSITFSGVPDKDVAAFGKVLAKVR